MAFINGCICNLTFSVKFLVVNLPEQFIFCKEHTHIISRIRKKGKKEEREIRREKESERQIEKKNPVFELSLPVMS